MTVWEKVSINLQRGMERIAVFAAFFSERVKAEARIVRLRLKLNSVQKRIDGLHLAIGKRIIEIQTGPNLPKSTDALFKDDVIAAALTEIAERTKEIEDLERELREERASVSGITKKSEDTVA